MAREPEHKTPEPKTEAPKTPDTTNTPVSINEPPGSGAVPEDQKPDDQKPDDKRSKK
jgi:hypothetical protein